MPNVYVGWMPNSLAEAPGGAVVKVGVTGDPKQRESQLERGLPFHFEMLRVFTGISSRVEDELKTLLVYYQPRYLRGEWYEIPDSGIDRIRAVDVFVEGRPPFGDECREIARQIVVALVGGPAGVFVPMAPRSVALTPRPAVVSSPDCRDGNLIYRGSHEEKPSPNRRRKDGSKGNPKGRVYQYARYTEDGGYTHLDVDGRIKSVHSHAIDANSAAATEPLNTH